MYLPSDAAKPIVVLLFSYLPTTYLNKVFYAFFNFFFAFELCPYSYIKTLNIDDMHILYILLQIFTHAL
jgi:hypothetical protein